MVQRVSCRRLSKHVDRTLACFPARSCLLFTCVPPRRCWLFACLPSWRRLPFCLLSGAKLFVFACFPARRCLRHACLPTRSCLLSSTQLFVFACFFAQSCLLLLLPLRRCWLFAWWQSFISQEKFERSASGFKVVSHPDAALMKALGSASATVVVVHITREM